VRSVEKGDDRDFLLSLRIQAYDAAGQVAADVTVGKSVAERAGIFCKLPGSADVYLLGGDAFTFYNMGLEYTRLSRRDLLSQYRNALNMWHSQVRVYVESEMKKAQDEGKTYTPGPLPEDILKGKPAVSRMERMVFNSKEMYDLTALKVARAEVLRIYIETPGQVIDLRRVESTDAGAVDEWQVKDASGFPHSGSISVKSDLVNNLLKRFEDGKGIQADNFAPESLIGDNVKLGLDKPFWKITLFGKGDIIWELAVGHETDVFEGDQRAAHSSLRPDDVFLMGPVIYKSFAFQPQEFLNAE
jgi:hypothetical protein